MSIEEAIFVILAIVGIFATILAVSALAADFFFPETPRQPRPIHRSQATYKKVPK